MISLRKWNKLTSKQIQLRCQVLPARLTSIRSSVYIILIWVFNLQNICKTRSNYIRQEPQRYALHFNERMIKTHFLLLQPSIRPVPAQVILMWKGPPKLCIDCNLVPLWAFPPKSPGKHYVMLYKNRQWPSVVYWVLNTDKCSDIWKENLETRGYGVTVIHFCFENMVLNSAAYWVLDHNNWPIRLSENKYVT